MKFLRKITSVLRIVFENAETYETPETLRMESEGRIATLEVF